mmetsp:Transcript_25628/g.101119  ORF Transcript_25628/g.101119 Transcript_25628/m.101119 type:complete len:221 (-) Transcript_25628:417-1079(-)|eukprot:CAMPEP_0113961960 /NCGR_PEP_ID=MMETSP0011_2-20120614/5631_1 /TAXON_ID=101924 /ORGANISM="Rhodosorus marinus" /LENGTH=220 /DNA_ID=CAMNT_0000973723 /DNA_START=161 /DNA_END=823 /DNA_ORIENTATION=+ /assembly_acc=CAM_ASM_000156
MAFVLTNGVVPAKSGVASIRGIGRAPRKASRGPSRCQLRMTATEPVTDTVQETVGMEEVGADFKVKLLYDGECPICMREVVFLMKKDAGRGLISFVDISDENYDPAQNADVSWEKAMGRIHAVLPDGSVIQGVKVFQKTYEVIGLGWLFEATKLPVVGNIADGVYDVWAKYRLRLTGRQDLEELIREKEEIARQLAEDEDCEDTCRAEYEDEEEADIGLS